MAIDLKRLEGAVAQAKNHGPTHGGFSGAFGGPLFASVPAATLYALIEAAESLLPKLVKVECWAVVCDDGTVSDVCSQKQPMEDVVRLNSDLTLVRLAGTAVIPPRATVSNADGAPEDQAKVRHP